MVNLAMESIHLSGNRVNYLQRNGNTITTRIEVHSEDVVDFVAKNGNNLQFTAVDAELDADIYRKVNGFNTLRDVQPSDETYLPKSEPGSTNNLAAPRKESVGRQSRSFLEALDLEDGSKILKQISMYRKNINCYECCYECPFHASIRKAVSLQTLTEKDKNKDFLWNRKYRKEETIKKDGNIWRNCVKQWTKFKYIWRKSKREVYHRNYGSISSRHYSNNEFDNSSHYLMKTKRRKLSLIKLLNCCICCVAENEENVPLRKRHRSYTIW